MLYIENHDVVYLISQANNKIVEDGRRHDAVSISCLCEVHYARMLNFNIFDLSHQMLQMLQWQSVRACVRLLRGCPHL